MKNFDDLTDAELHALTPEEITYYIDLECAEQGIKLLPPSGPPIKPDKGMTADDLELWEVGGHHFRDKADADRVAAAIAGGQSRVQLEYISGPSYRKKAVPATDSVSGVNLVRVLSQERHAALTQIIEEQEQALKTFTERQREYDKIVSSRSKVVSYVREKIEEAAQRERRRNDLRETFRRYVELAKGDKDTAMRFLLTSEPEARELLAKDDLPWPETEYQREGIAAAVAATLDERDDEDAIKF